MADYYPLIARAVADLDKNTGDARRALYDRARAALVAQLRRVKPAREVSDILREQLALEQAIRKVEDEAVGRARTSRSDEAPTRVKAPEFPARKEPYPKPEPVELEGRLDRRQRAAQLAREIEEAEARRVIKEAGAKRLEAEAEAKRLEEEAEARRLEAEAEAKRLEAEAEARLKREAEAKRLEEEAEARRLEEEAEAKRLEAEAEAKRLEAEAEAKRHEAERRPRLRARLAEVASPAPSIAPDGRLDAGPNEVYDSPTEDSDLPALPIQQRAVIKTILSGLPSNAPRHLRSSLESYDDELRARGVQAILGLLKNMAEIIEAAIGAPNARQEWLEDGMYAAFKVFSEYHALFVKHFPLDPEREELYSLTPVDESSATGSKLFGPFEEVAAAAVEANKGRLTTDEFLRVVKKVAEYAKVISSLPPTTYSWDGGLPTVDLIPPASTKKRIILSGLGFFERAYNLLGTSVTLASTPEGIALLTEFRNAIDALSKLL
jgi:hypothetical protein